MGDLLICGMLLGFLGWSGSFRAAFNPMIVPNSTLVSSLFNEDREWDFQLSAIWMVPSVASSLNLIPRLPNNHEDKLIWKDATSGEFSTRVAYKSIIKSRRAENDPIWGHIWKLKISERMKLFLWKLGRDILPFGERLQRIFGNEVMCAICDEQEDSAVHLFCHCPLAKSLWLASPWGVRNSSIDQSSLDAGLEVCRESLWCLLMLLAKISGQLRESLSLRLIPRFVEAFSAQLQAVLPLEAEAWALLHAVHRCLAKDGTMLLLQWTVNFWCGALRLERLRTGGLQGVRSLLDALDCIPSASVVWIPRTGNEKAHKLAKWSFNSYQFGFFNAEELAPLVAI
ncbi:hypothetical protein F8388_011660 [Cannabis sativa]|uniref:Reverse transcriptase zinc-binding domain-containing protein n=1 Tax=Cannabis sativa TaxID=3483 RepID=A0A7J6GX36_CANSA|nr:hypothetical protein F8388_011660 [Cannabis sativa]